MTAITDQPDMALSRNIVDYWSSVPGDAKYHPDDAIVLGRADHSFRQEGLPNPYFGPLSTARIVLLYLSPGYRDPQDRDLALLPETHEHFRRQRSGEAPLPSALEYEPTWKWWNKRTSQLGLSAAIASQNVAFLNICAYRSKNFTDPEMLSALPSSRASVGWAQTTLFPEAEAGRRVVICLRAAPYWGLSKKVERYGRSLFAPQVTRSGIMLRGAIRDTVVAAIKVSMEAPKSTSPG